MAAPAEEWARTTAERGSAAASAGTMPISTVSAPAAARVDPSHQHVFDEGVVTREPTCTEEGERLLTCTLCGENGNRADRKAAAYL